MRPRRSRIRAAGMLSGSASRILRHGSRFSSARDCHGGLHGFRQSLFAAGAVAGAVARFRRQCRRHQRHDHRADGSHRADCAVHRGACGCTRAPAPDYRGGVRHRGSDAGHGAGDERVATCHPALRAGAVATADFHRRRRLCRRRMAAGGRCAHHWAVCFRLERRRLLRPFRHRRRG